jgi:hypothetical protein
MNFEDIDLTALDPLSEVAQARLARLALSFLTGDPLLSESVFEDINTDPDGTYIALTNLVMALTTGLVESWTRDLELQVVIDSVRAQLAALEVQEK